jgi:exosortase
MSSVANPVLQPPAEPQSVKIPWVSLAWFFGLLVLCYAPVLNRLIQQWNDSEDMGHGFFVPVLAAYIAWLKREELLSADVKPNYFGLVIVALAALQLWIGTLGAELFLTRTAFVESLIGCVIFLGGWTAVHILAFPLFLLFFMVPIPGVVYNEITFPLQILASNIAAAALEFLGVPVLRDGNILELPSQKLSVVEACSGIRSLLTLTFLSLVYGYFFDNRKWMRVALFVLTVPIAIAANAGRVTVTGLASEYNPELAHGFAHTASGWVIFMIALAILILTHQCLSRISKAIKKS